jgi:Short C-terminal domain
VPFGRNRRQRRRRVAAAAGGAYALHKHHEHKQEEEQQEQQQQHDEEEEEQIPAAESVPAAPAVDPYAQLGELKGLLDSGAITQDEYDGEKQKILSS